MIQNYMYDNRLLFPYQDFLSRYRNILSYLHFVIFFHRLLEINPFHLGPLPIPWSQIEYDPYFSGNPVLMIISKISCQFQLVTRKKRRRHALQTRNILIIKLIWRRENKRKNRIIVCSPADRRPVLKFSPSLLGRCWSPAFPNFRLFFSFSFFVFLSNSSFFFFVWKHFTRKKLRMPFSISVIQENRF